MQWSKRHPSYWSEQRLQSQAEVLERSGGKVKIPGPPAGMSGLPTAWAQDAMGAKGLVIALFLARLVHRTTQAAMEGQRAEIQGEIRQQLGRLEQAEMEFRGPAP